MKYVVLLSTLILAGCTITWSPGHNPEWGYPGQFHYQETVMEEADIRAAVLEAQEEAARARWIKAWEELEKEQARVKAVQEALIKSQEEVDVQTPEEESSQ